MIVCKGRRRAARARHATAVTRLLAIGAVAIAAGCATVAGDQAAPREATPQAAVTKDAAPDVKRAAVRDRVKARWAALVKGDEKASYDFLTPATRAVLTLDQYRKTARTTGFRSADIESIDCSEQSCKVKLWVTFDHGRVQGIRTSVEETWVIDAGSYWYVWPF